MSPPRVALCTDTYDEINGVATVSQQFVAFAQRRGLPLLVVRPGSSCRIYREDSVTFVEVRRSPLCLPLDMGLRFDLLIPRHYTFVRKQLAEFAPEVVHICGPGDIGMLCGALSHYMQVPKIPLVAAWHTNVHQYARLRMAPVLRWLPEGLRATLSARIEAESFRAAALFYKIARLVLAPNPEILSDLTRLTKKPGRLMPHGVDTGIFAPAAERTSGPITLGYVGRLTPEKNVRFLAELAERLPEDVRARVRFLIVGDGSERAWLEHRLPRARFTGILRHGELARAYAEMDVFLFPSRSDTFGLVVLEAMAAGLPVVAFHLSGPMSAVEDGKTGYAAETTADFGERVARLVSDDELRHRLGRAARESALHFDWDAVFESIYGAYGSIVTASEGRR